MSQNDLFIKEKEISSKQRPLAFRMSPKSLNEYFGQEEILGKGKLLRRLIEADRLGSVIFFGPPGSGKSALARIIAVETDAHFEQTNAVMIGVSDIRKIIEHAKLRLKTTGKKTILLLDEIHHFNKTQQDALLPDVESGLITLIGITTENPYFYINSAIISRSTVFEFKPLEEKDVKTVLERVLTDKENGFGNYKIKMSEEARNHLIAQSQGDARRLLNAIEIGVLSTEKDEKGEVDFDIKVAEESLQQKVLLYDKSSDEHYDHVSAFIKSMRGSNPDAALYWMAKMLLAGEDPRFIVRRIVICASEDVGNADPHALLVAVAALRAVEFVGMPEARLTLAQAVTYIASAPKSNASTIAIGAAEEAVRKEKPRTVPIHLKDANMDGETRGHGKGYKYPHDFPGHFVSQEYWPDEKVFYEPSDQGYESKIRERLSNWRKQS